jgi:hypothetical protein
LTYTSRVDIIVATMAKLREQVSQGAWIYALGNGLRAEYKDTKQLNHPRITLTFTKAKGARRVVEKASENGTGMTTLLSNGPTSGSRPPLGHPPTIISNPKERGKGNKPLNKTCGVTSIRHMDTPLTGVSKTPTVLVVPRSRNGAITIMLLVAIPQLNAEKATANHHYRNNWLSCHHHSNLLFLLHHSTKAMGRVVEKENLRVHTAHGRVKISQQAIIRQHQPFKNKKANKNGWDHNNQNGGSETSN